jgi:UDP-GlcNAc:undecaprenyl-phosphate/decaprenyl-phosphate GlcNAc-1-phosphate transferase
MQSTLIFSLLAKVSGAGLISFAVTTALVAFTIRLCRAHGWVAKPRSDRWHKSTPAFFGGVPIWCGFMLTALALLPFSYHLLWKVIGIAALLFLLGFLDDIFHFRAGPKLLVQIVAALLVLNSGLFYPLRDSILVNGALSLLWIVGITNAFNLLDNMDGLSGGVALISAVYLCSFFLGRAPQGSALLVAMLVGAIGGFLVFNFYPAKIFMGDGGSLFIGFLLATVSLFGITHVAGVPGLVLAPITVLAIPLLDTFAVSITRRLRGQPISVGGTDHSSHRLVRLGLHERDAVLLLYGLTAASGMIALILRKLLYPQAIGLIAFWYLFLAVFGIHLFRTNLSGQPAVVHSRKSRFISRLLSHDALVFLLDPIVLSISYYLAYFLRFGASVLPGDAALFLRSWPIVLAIKFLSLYSSRVYSHSWWRGSVSDVYAVGRATIIGEIVSVLALLAFYRFAGFSRFVFVLDFLLSWWLLFALRKSASFFRDSLARLRCSSESQPAVFVLGTSEHAEIALRYLRGKDFRCAGLIDMNGGADLGRRVWGIQVVGHWNELPALAAEYGVTKIILPEHEPIPCSEQEFLNRCQREQIHIVKLGLYSVSAKSATASL